MMRSLHLCMIALISLNAAAADLPSAKAIRTKAPKVDGALDDACWQRAARLDLRLLDGGKPTQRTVAKVCTDGATLFIAMQCDEADMAKLIKGNTKRDGHHWNSDCVEIFIDPGGKAKSYCHLAVSAAGGIADEKVTDMSWNAEWTAATKLGPKGWSVELAIPFGSLDLAPGDDPWRINFCREEKPHQENSAWAPVAGSFHDPKHFGKLTIDADLSPFHCALSVLPSAYSLGENTLSVAIKNMAKAERRGSVVVTAVGPDGTDLPKGKRWLVMPPNATSQASVKLTLPKLGQYDLLVKLFQGQRFPVAVTRATIQVPSVRIMPKGARVRWIRHQRGQRVTLLVVHDCTFRDENISFELLGLPDRVRIEVVGEGRSLESKGGRFTDRFQGYTVRRYRWAAPAARGK